MNPNLTLTYDPVGGIDLTDLDLDEANGGSWTATIGITIGLVSLIYCSQNTVCGTCNIGGSGC